VRVKVDCRRQDLHAENVEFVALSKAANQRAKLAEANKTNRVGKLNQRLDRTKSGCGGKRGERYRKNARAVPSTQHRLAETHIPISCGEDVDSSVWRSTTSQDASEKLVVYELDHSLARS
jgi:hypothetical protein